MRRIKGISSIRNHCNINNNQNHSLVLDVRASGCCRVDGRLHRDRLGTRLVSTNGRRKQSPSVNQSKQSIETDGKVPALENQSIALMVIPKVKLLS